MIIKGTDEFASFSEAAVCMIDTYGGNMENEEEAHAVLDRLTDILVRRKVHRIRRRKTALQKPLTPEEQYIYDTLSEEAEKRDTV